MIGYYVHHHGNGHLHRAQTIAAASEVSVTGLSSLPRPRTWTGDWVQLARDDGDAAGYAAGRDVTAHGRLHWVPLGDPGLRGRMASLSHWIDRTSPQAMVVDQSVEVCLLARLHGVPTIGLTAPGHRTDPAHRLGFDACTELVGPWPAGWTDRMLPGQDDEVATRFHAVGGVSRLPVAARSRSWRRRPHAVLLAGTGGDGFTRDSVAAMQARTPGWDWTVLSRTLGTWHADPASVLAKSDVAVIHPGQNSLAEIAASRLPAVVVPAPRPFDEQHVTADALRHGWPAVVVDNVSDAGVSWADVLDRARGLDGEAWSGWVDGRAAHRAAQVVARAVDRAGLP
ncbi:hypothetical protein [Nocardioides currus]|uniref:Uncharacterized protein n=1 Tax=Nocardioides currus TaxID=2133958 RepID=A0A2R7YUW8_9ACTN|nr:hypothetical protein [Nocardioides currus]PUA80165.1 hypothetical protein C7S10_16650 [Nocardioides currus]